MAKMLRLFNADFKFYYENGLLIGSILGFLDPIFTCFKDYV